MSSGRENGAGGPRRRDMSLLGISDTELLAVIDDLGDEDGWVAILDVRVQLGENPEDSSGRDSVRSGVGPRMSWQRRYGWLEKHPDTGLWRLTAMGTAILKGGSLSSQFEKLLSNLNPAQRVQLTREVSQAGDGAPEAIRAALRREWQRNMTRRR